MVVGLALPLNGNLVHKPTHAITRDLPTGWLGKIHVLYRGVGEAAGDWLLFADADIQFDPNAFRRAVAYAEKERLDHLTLVPDLHAGSYLLRGWVAFFQMPFSPTCLLRPPVSLPGCA